MQKNKKSILKDNKISAQNISFSLSNIFPGKRKLALTEVRPVAHYDSERNRTEQIDGFKYTVVEMETLSSFCVRVNSTAPVITPEELEDSEERVFIEFPMDETLVKPYKVEYGIATVSILAPYAKLVNPEIEDEEE